MLHNEARKLLIQAWNKTQNVKEVPACFGSKRKSSWQAVHDWIHGTAHTAAKEFSWNYWTASSNVTVIKFKINLQESLHNHFVWKCLNAYVSGNWNHQKSLISWEIRLQMELLGRFELPTSSLPRMRSTYWAIAACEDFSIFSIMATQNGLEPSTSSVTG